ncbi:MAG TPA: autotransporter-associated beta strand repeat-containing protein, partial [Prosthecobacter sp.]|nr:autotransporter-associated beta strand repeat-containing protein [Prosthecobacter sp.]
MTSPTSHTQRRASRCGKKMRSILYGITSALLLLGFWQVCGPLQAATYNWNTTDGTWDTSTANWAGPSLWVNGNDAVFNNTATLSTITLGSTITANSVLFGSALNNNGNFTLSGGTLNVSGTFNVLGDAASGNDYSASPKVTVSSTNVAVTGNTTVGRANLVISGGTFTTASFVQSSVSSDWANLVIKGTANVTADSVNLANGSTSTGQVILGGGTLTTGSITAVDREPNVNNTSVLLFNGTQVIASASSATFVSVAFIGSNANQAYIGTGGALINTNGFDDTITSALKDLSSTIVLSDMGLDGAVAGAGFLTKSGNGTLTLTGANTYTGLTTVSVGTLQVGNGEANTSVGASSFSVASGARLAFFRNTDSTDFTTQAISGAGDVEFKGQSQGYFRFAGGFTAALTYTGRTIVNFDAPVGGTAGYQRVLWLEKDDVLPHATVLDLQSGKVYMRSNTTLGETIGGLTGNAGTYISTDQTLVQKLTIDTASGGPHTYAGVIGVDPTWVSSTSNISLTKTGAGTQILTGANTYTGATTISAGNLTVKGANSSSGFAISSGAVLEFNINASTTQDYGTTSFSGAGTLQKTGTGEIRWGSAPATFALDSGSLIDVQAGLMVGGQYANENWTNNKADLNIASGAYFAGVEANVRVDALTGGGTLSTGFTGGYGYTSFTMGADNGGGTFSGTIIDGVVSLGGFSDFGGAVATGNVTKIGSGTQILTGANTYTGLTTISGGTLQLGNGGGA